MATQPVRLTTGTMAFIPPNGTTTIQAGQVIPSTIIHTQGVVGYTSQPLESPSNQLIQPSGMVQHLQYLGQQPGSPNNQCPQNPQMRLWEKLYKAESKTLGAIQILIGLMHIGFGGASLGSDPLRSSYMPSAAVAGYPFWGGLFFIISGSLSVSAENHPNSCLVRCSVGFNITSTIITLTGFLLYILEFAINFSNYNGDLRKISSSSLSILLLLFSVLEFCITVSTAHFGCQAACCTNDTPVVFVPYAAVVPAEGSLNPPASNNVDSSSMRMAEERTQDSNDGQ